MDADQLLLVRLFGIVSTLVLLLYYFLPLPFAIRTQTALLPTHHIVYLMAIGLFAAITAVPRWVPRVFERLPLYVSLLLIIGLSWGIGAISCIAMIPTVHLLALPLFAWLAMLPVISSHCLAFVKQNREGTITLLPAVRLNHTRLIVLVGGSLILTAAALWFPSQSAVTPELKAVVAFSIYLLPGVFLASLLLPEQRSISRLITYSVPLSVVTLSLPFLTAWYAGWNMTIVSGIWFGLTVIFGFGVLLQNRERTIVYPAVTIHWSRLFGVGVLMLVVVIMLMVAYISVWYHPWLANSDALSYNTYTMYFARASSLEHIEPFLGTSNPTSYRFLLSLLPANLGFMASVSDAHMYLIQGMLTCGFLSLSCVITYDLARTLDFDWQQGIVAVIIYCVLLVVLEASRYNERDIMFHRLLEDKFFAAYILFPVVVQGLVQWFKQRHWRHFLLWILCVFSLVFIHPTMLLFTAIILGFYCLWQMGLNRQWRAGVQALLVMAICMTPFLLIRMVFDRSEDDGHILGSVGEYAETRGMQMTADYQGYVTDRFYAFEGGRWYMISPESLANLGTVILVAASVMALLRFKNTHMHAFVLASSLTLLITVIPYTSWLIGQFATPGHLVRLRWFMPYAIAGVMIWQLLPMRYKQASKGSPQVMFWGSIGVLFALLYLALPTNVILNRFDQSLPELERLDVLADIVAVGEYLDHELDEPTMIAAEDGFILSNIPVLSHRANTLFFREPQMMRTQSNISSNEVAQRLVTWKALGSAATPPEKWLSLVAQYDIAYVITRPGDTLHERATGDLRGVLQRVFEAGQFDVYRIR